MARRVADLRAAVAALNFWSLLRQLGALIQAASSSFNSFVHSLQMEMAGSISLGEDADPFIFTVTVDGRDLVGTVRSGPQARGSYTLCDAAENGLVRFPDGMELRVPPYDEPFHSH